MITIMRKLGVGGKSLSTHTVPISSLARSSFTSPQRSGSININGCNGSNHLLLHHHQFHHLHNSSSNNNNNNNNHSILKGIVTCCNSGKKCCCTTIMSSSCGLCSSSGSSLSSLSSPLSSSSTISSISTSQQLLLHSRRKRKIERYAVVVVVIVAWAWIIVTFGTVLYHTYMGQPLPGLLASSSLSKTTTTKTTTTSSRRTYTGSTVIDSEGIRSKIEQVKNNSTRSSFQLMPYESPLIIFTCSRPDYLKETLADIFKYIPNDCSIGCPVIVSQDGYNPIVAETIQKFQTDLYISKSIPVFHIQHNNTYSNDIKLNAYNALAIHYGWALTKVFDGSFTTATSDSSSSSASSNNNNYKLVIPERVIILEEDLHIAPDFFDYFKSTSSLLYHDSTLLAISAFNDNGYESMVHDPYRLLRSDFFPGLGWMMSSTLWNIELKSKWPHGYWDDWLREPTQRKGRHIIHPEISRTYHFGTKGGASSNQFGTSLSKIQLNTVSIDWSNEDLSYLDQNQYDRNYYELIQSARYIHKYQDAITYLAESSISLDTGDTNFRMEYNTYNEFKYLVHTIEPYQLMDDEKAGITRTSYNGIVETRIPLSSFGIFLENNNNHNNNNDKVERNLEDMDGGTRKLYHKPPILFITPPIRQLERTLLGSNTNR